jgi:hypothetical protein
MFCTAIVVREIKSLNFIALRGCLKMYYFFRRYKFSMKAILCNVECCYVVESDLQLNNTHRTDCCAFIAKMVRRTRHNVTFVRTLPVVLQYV